MNELYKKPENCCGCSACMNICPKKAIKMESDCEGFLYPQIDETKCVDCGLCIKVCPWRYDIQQKTEKPMVYAVKHKNDNVRANSTSGGLFTALSDCILDEGGVVYGAVFDDDFNVIHSRAENRDERDRQRGSKYVQSYLGNIFDNIKNDLKDKPVLFTGTPCQCDGLRAYLKISGVNTDNLFLCDLVCHGVPSPLLWREHIESLNRKYNKKIKAYYCRSKALGWHGHNEMCVYENGKVDYRSPFVQKQKKIFYSNNALRMSCYNCQYTNLNRISDVTIADFWGIEKYMSDFDDNKGISLLLVNTLKGKEIFDKISDKIEYRESDCVQCMQPQLKAPSPMSSVREQFWKDYRSRGYKYICKQYANCSVKSNLIFHIKIILYKLHMHTIVSRILKILRKKGR